MLIVADENMPLVREAFAPLGEVRTISGRNMRADAVADADVLLVRSVTRVDRALLEHSRVRFVGTATIGTDHLDLDYLHQRGIAVASAPGSNANAVVDYVVSALSALDGVLEKLLGGQRVGIIGLGNVGSRLLARLQRLGVDCVGYDPLLPLESELPLAGLNAVLAADVICCHAPLTRTGAFPSLHLLDAQRLRQLRADAVILSAGRGAVIDNAALKQLLRERTDLRAILDVWENEPNIDCELLDLVTIGTPHIAGYSLDGKIAGTRMMLEACCRFLGLAVPVLPPAQLAAPHIWLPQNLSGAALIRAAVLAAYAVHDDDQRMRAALHGDDPIQIGSSFDLLRKNYPERREFSACHIDNWQRFALAEQQLLMRVGFTAPVV